LSAVPSVNSSREKWLVLFFKVWILIKARSLWLRTGCDFWRGTHSESVVRAWSRLDAWLADFHSMFEKPVIAVRKAPPPHLSAAVGVVPVPPIPKSPPRQVSAPVNGLRGCNQR
jgi:hypothetical protein